MSTARRRTTRRWSLTVALATATLATLYAGSFAWDYSALWRRPDPLLADDYARLTPTRVARASPARRRPQTWPSCRPCWPMRVPAA
jgi:hypothetical protein